MPDWLTVSFLIQTAASLTTVAGIWLNPAKLVGAILYSVSLVFWWILMFHDGLWGLIPLEIALVVVMIRNFWRLYKKLPV